VRQVRESDFGFFWAAYKQGSFADLIAPDLPARTFQLAVEELLGSVDYDWVVERKSPIGLFLGNRMGNGRGAEVQLEWFPWASAREKLEGTATFLRETQRQV
jgi:hypothetical protein